MIKLNCNVTLGAPYGALTAGKRIDGFLPKDIVDDLVKDGLAGDEDSAGTAIDVEAAEALAEEIIAEANAKAGVILQQAHEAATVKANEIIAAANTKSGEIIEAANVKHSEIIVAANGEADSLIAKAKEHGNAEAEKIIAAAKSNVQVKDDKGTGKGGGK